MPIILALSMMDSTHAMTLLSFFQSSSSLFDTLGHKNPIEVYRSDLARFITNSTDTAVQCKLSLFHLKAHIQDSHLLHFFLLVQFLAELDGSEYWRTDIGNAFMEAFTKKACIVAGSEFGPLQRHILIINKDSYGLTTSGLH